jgi:hypothetical protein
MGFLDAFKAILTLRTGPAGANGRVIDALRRIRLIILNPLAASASLHQVASA